MGGGGRTARDDGMLGCDEVLLGDHDIRKGAVPGAADVFEAGQAWWQRRWKVVFEVDGEERVDGVDIVLILQDARKSPDCLRVVFDRVHGIRLRFSVNKVSQSFR
jgi:hypothetical protein